jgi:foldase protein PrsA
MRGNILLVSLLLVACGSSKPPAKEPHYSDEDMAEIKCIEVAKIPRQAASDAPARISVSHIVIRHAGVRDAGQITRSRGEACLRAELVRKKLLGGTDWDDVFEKFSDSKDSTKGTFSNISQSDLEDDFASAAFALKVDELSHVVETTHGFHVIWRSK